MFLKLPRSMSHQIVLSPLSNLFKLDQIRSNLFKLVQTCSNMIKLVQTCSKLIKLVQTCSNLIKLDQNGLDLKMYHRACRQPSIDSRLCSLSYVALCSFRA